MEKGAWRLNDLLSAIWTALADRGILESGFD